MDVNLASGGKHWTKDEIETRRSTEVQLAKPEKLKVPKWLSAEAAKLYRAYAKLLLANLPATNLDAGTLARMCDAEVLYGKAAAKRDEALEDDDQEAVAFWIKAMASAEKIARGSANDLGCTITSRCRMVVPQTQDAEDDPLERLLVLNA